MREPGLLRRQDPAIAEIHLLSCLPSFCQASRARGISIALLSPTSAPALSSSPDSAIGRAADPTAPPEARALDPSLGEVPVEDLSLPAAPSPHRFLTLGSAVAGLKICTR